MARINLRRCVRLMADYSSTGVWNSDGSSMSLSRLPISDELTEAISEWADFYDRYSTDYSYPNSTSPMFGKFDGDRHAASGRLLAKRLQAELPDWSVVYFDDMTMEHEYIVDQVADHSAWPVHVEEESYTETNADLMFSWLEQNDIAYQYRWHSRSFWFKTEHEAALFTLRWA